MKKHIATYRLNRDTNARQALFKNLMVALVTHESISTTHAKAMAVRGQFEKLLTRAKEGTVVARRAVQAVLQDASLVKKLVGDIAPRYAGVNGGYTHIIMVGTRKGDNASLVRLELTKQKPSEPAPVNTKATKGEVVKKTAKPVAPIMAPRVERVQGQPLTTRLERHEGTRRGDR